jgi:DNA-binding XRE family transcriptional regulator
MVGQHNYGSKRQGKTDSCPEENETQAPLPRNITILRVIITLYVANCPGLAKVILVITGRQIRAARALLGWSQQQLADSAIISVNAVRRLEGDSVDPRVSTVMAAEKALSLAGIEFLPAEGIRLGVPAHSRGSK